MAVELEQAKQTAEDAIAVHERKTGALIADLKRQLRKAEKRALKFEEDSIALHNSARESPRTRGHARTPSTLSTTSSLRASRESLLVEVGVLTFCAQGMALTCHV